MKQARARVFIRGRVQGVNFRYYTQLEASKTAIKGWVRNLMDGRVEAVFEGEREDVERMIDWTKSGPAAARVEHVVVEWEAPTGEFSDFRVRMTTRGK
jgi:acylphosphatase